MVFYAAVCLVIAVVTGLLGFTAAGATVAVAGIAKVLCYVFVGLSAISVVLQRYVPTE